MSLSVITPTEERPDRLIRLYQQLRLQRLADWEWIIYDCSLRPCKEIQAYNDPRIRYFHTVDRITIGERRNQLVKLAKSDLIVHFDDDDYYAPEYLAIVKEALKQADLFHIDSWFAYHEGSKQYFYWDSQVTTPRRMSINPLIGATVREINFGQEATRKMVETGYGFTFAYRKEVALQHPFPDLDHREDTNFFSNFIDKRIVSLADRDGVVLKVIHDNNVSCIFPQYMIPRFLLNLTHPHLFAHENRTSCS